LSDFPRFLGRPLLRGVGYLFDFPDFKNTRTFHHYQGPGVSHGALEHAAGLLILLWQQLMFFEDQFGTIRQAVASR